MSNRIFGQVQLRNLSSILCESYGDRATNLELNHPSCQGLFPQVHQTLRLDPDVTTATLANCHLGGSLYFTQRRNTDINFQRKKIFLNPW